MIQAKRVRGNTVHPRMFTPRQWNEKNGPQTKGWVLATADLESEKVEAKAGRDNSVSLAVQEELSRVNKELDSAKAESERLQKEYEALKEQNAILAENQKGKAGRKPKEEA